MSARRGRHGVVNGEGEKFVVANHQERAERALHISVVFAHRNGRFRSSSVEPILRTSELPPLTTKGRCLHEEPGLPARLVAAHLHQESRRDTADTLQGPRTSA